MVKLIIAAAIALVGVVAGGLVAQLPDSPAWLITVAGIAATVSAAVGGPKAAAWLGSLIPKKVRDEIVIVGTRAMLLSQAGAFAAITVPGWLHISIAVLIAVLYALGIRFGVTPLSNPRGNDGAALVPFWAQQTAASASAASGTVGKATIAGATLTSASSSGTTRRRRTR